MYNPLVSIIIPVYNGSNYLKQSIESALAQTYKNIEVVVVNDGSTDDGKTERIALSYGEKIRYFYKENGGVATALNFGIENMTGNWFSWLSHDDLYMPNKIESQIRKINELDLNTESTIISCKNGYIDANGSKVIYPNNFNSGLFSGNEMFALLLKGQNLNGCSLLIPKKALIETKGFNINYRFIQDFTCWVDLALNNNSFYLYDEELVKSRLHGEQDTIRLSSVHPKEIDDFLNKLLLRFKVDVSKNKNYIKDILFYYCTRKNNVKFSRKYKEVLIENGLFNTTDYTQYFALFVRGKIIWSMRNIYRTLVNKQYRR
ncbi:glycosyltransferase [Bacillus sp. FJAT-18017]|uniref:glycosyltransferase n=1 Tax=Bacillus sp. FJAT-18017 TaxID=1705566 RepID=UPI0006ADE702|nr:glycosyltransferase [Bacillus sp. FJAT-18017]